MNQRDIGRSYLSHLKSEHNHLELAMAELIQRIQQSTDEGWEQGDRTDVAARLGAVKVALLRHIREEEEDGCLDEAVARLPSLAADAAMIARDHDALTEQMHEVMEVVRSGSRTECENAALQFATHLKHHEQQEERVVEQGLNEFPDDQQPQG